MVGEPATGDFLGPWAPYV